MLFSRSSIYLLSLLAAVGAALPASAQVSPRPLAGTYRYVAYVVFEAESPNEPTTVRGVGGTLTLRPDGTYAKRLSITLGAHTVPFTQDGTYALSGDSIRFAFRDQKGADVQRGTARLDSVGRHLTLTILGYPAGSQGVYELEAAPTATVLPAPAAPVAVPAAPARPKARKKARR